MNENTGVTLPALSAESIARIEGAVFEEIADEPPRLPAHVPAEAARSRRRRWLTGLGVAAAFVGGILIAPPLLQSVSVGPSSVDYAVTEDAGEGVSAGAPDPQGVRANPETRFQEDADDASASPGREIITTAELTLRVPVVQDASEAIGELAAEHGGYVERANTRGSGMPVGDAESGSITIRVPADALDDVMRALDDDGEVLRSSIARQDVTSQAVDLRAAVTASQASVKRLTELMSKSGSVADLIAAETALNERQAELEGYQQQLKSLDAQVAMSTVSIALISPTAAVDADPAGFTDGLSAGWNGLIVALNALVVALGFLLPWVAIAGAVVLVVWLVRRRRRSRDA